MSRLPLNTLVAFRAVAEAQNLRAAALQLHLTHSAVSQQIRALEERLGFALFDRHGRRVVLNRAGEALLRAVQGALARIDEGVQAARSAAAGDAPALRVTVLPSFAHRWLLPRLARWRERHPQLALEIEASFRTVDLVREGFHAAVREGHGPWPGLASVQLFDQQMIVLGSPAAARRLRGATIEAIAREPLLGEDVAWEDWFAEAGLTIAVRPVASFNDAGLMLQAAEQDLGIAISREMLAADALVGGRLVRLSPVKITHPDARPYHFVYPPHLAEWPPLVALRDWLTEEIAASQRALQLAARTRRGRARTAPASADAPP